MTQLTELNIEEVSLVDAGANPQANILLFKRKEVEKMPEEILEVQEKSESDDTSSTGDVKKSADLEQERAELAKAQETVNSLIATLQEHVEKAETAELLKVAKKYEILGHKAEDLAEQLRGLKKFPEMYESLIKSFDGALAAVEKSRAYEEIGKSGRNMGVIEIEKVADEIQKQNPEMSRRDAIDKAYRAHPELQG